MEVTMQSLHEFVSSFSVNKAVLVIMAIFMVVGGIDKIRGNKKGYGQEFDAGFEAMGPLAIAMVGMIVMAPVIKIVLGSAMEVFFSAIGADPSLFAGIFLGTDMGGYQLAMSLAKDQALGNFNGMIVTSMIGACISFNIPVGVGMISRKNHPHFAGGMLLGFATVPVSCLAGGLAMMAAGFDITFRGIIMNTIPVAVVSCLIIVGLVFFQDKLMRAFIVFGKGVMNFITIGTILATFQYLTGIRLPLLHVMVDADANGVVPLVDAVKIVGCISLVLIGAFPMIKFITGVFGSPLQRCGSRFGLDETSIAGLIATVANNIPTFKMIDRMNDKGKILNCAFIVSTSFALGDYLGFCAGANPSMISSLLVAKFAGGISAIILANFTWKRFCPKDGLEVNAEVNADGNTYDAA